MKKINYSSKPESKIYCTATGDSMITRRLPCDGDYDGFGAVRNFIMQGALRFGNLETTIHNFEACGGARSGGSWLCSPPGVLDDLRKFGINILSAANNHALDYSYDGLRRTIHYLENAGFPFAGIGENLADASRPVYLDTVGGRCAMIACTMAFAPEHMAGTQTANLPGRPGVNGIRISKKYGLPRAELLHLKRIAEALQINAGEEIVRAEGYRPQLKPNEYPFGELMFEDSDKAEIRLSINDGDMKRITEAVAEARFMADYVIVAMHNHEIVAKSKEAVDPVSVEFAHRCLDSGADAVIGTGPHLLRPVEIYQGKPIFYSLGDFIIQLETIFRAPDEMFAKQNMDGNSRLDMMFNARSDNGKRGLSYSRVMYESVIPYWEVENGELCKMTFMPVEEQFAMPRSRGGWPRHDATKNILERFAEMSKAYGVEIKIENGLGVVKF